MNYFLSFLGLMLFAYVAIKIVARIISDSEEKRELERDRDIAVKNAQKEREARKALEDANTNKAVENDDYVYWQKVFYNKELPTIRVNDRQYQKLLCDATFTVNASGSYKSVLGVYKDSKVMLARKAKNANSSEKTTTETKN